MLLEMSRCIIHHSVNDVIYSKDTCHCSYMPFSVQNSGMFIYKINPNIYYFKTHPTETLPDHLSEQDLTPLIYKRNQMIGMFVMAKTAAIKKSHSIKSVAHLFIHRGPWVRWRKGDITIHRFLPPARQKNCICHKSLFSKLSGSSIDPDNCRMKGIENAIKNNVANYIFTALHSCSSPCYKVCNVSLILQQG